MSSIGPHHIIQRDESAPPLFVSKERRIAMPLALMLSLGAVVAFTAVRWAGTEKQVADNTRDIGAIQVELRATREILIRIDENVKDLRRSTHRD